MKKILFSILKVSEKSSRIWSWIRIRIWMHESDVQVRGSGYTTKCHGSPTLVITQLASSEEKLRFLPVIIKQAEMSKKSP
jgi:hypothetical protein